MKAPKNFYNTVDQRKLGLDNLPGFPVITPSDEGKILKVDETGNLKLSADSGVSTMLVTISYDEGDDEYSADKTHAQIVEALASGNIVTAAYDGRTYVYAGKNKPAAFDAVYFSYLQADSESEFIGKIFEIDEDDRITYSEHDLNNDSVLPHVTAADNGSVLTVVDGEWAPHFFNDTTLLWDPSEIVSGEYVSNSDGSIVTDATGARSPKVEVVSNKVTIFTASDWNNIYNCWYDADGNFISSFTLTRGNTTQGALEVVNKPSNAKFLCLSNSVASMPYIKAWDGEII